MANMNDKLRILHLSAHSHTMSIDALAERRNLLASHLALNKKLMLSDLTAERRKL